MPEYAVCFPADRQSLVGVFAKAERSHPQAPVIVFLNAGLIPRTGPNRLYVRLARESARLGLSSLRFDLSGIGDSLPRTDGLPFRDAALRDVQEALDFLSASTGAASFILVGLCSGADLAFRVSTLDDRIVGAVLLDGLPYRTFRSKLNDQVLRFRRGLANGGWSRLLSPNGPVLRNLGRFITGNGVVASGRMEGLTSPGGRDIPSVEEAESALLNLVARGVRIMVVYTEARGYNYQGQFADVFPRVPADSVAVEYFEAADHTFNLLANQDRIVRTLIRWTPQFLHSSSLHPRDEVPEPSPQAT
jgi:hypothetical protein